MPRLRLNPGWKPRLRCATLAIEARHLVVAQKLGYRTWTFGGFFLGHPAEHPLTLLGLHLWLVTVGFCFRLVIKRIHEVDGVVPELLGR